MKTQITQFIAAEDGGGVVDMTMLMAAMAGLALAVMSSVSTGMEVLTTEMETTMVALDADAAWD